MSGFDNHFLEDEVREGFYVPAIMKQCWAAQLEVLSQLNKVCERHHIQYFAEWGSLLGAVRHGGFIPWDDDLDIVMKRDDYDAFMKVSHELPPGFEVQTYRNREGYIQFITNVIGKSRICFEPEHYEQFHGFPYICGLDIFIIDYITPDPDKERRRDKETLYVVAAADAIAEGALTGRAKEEELCKIESLSGERIDRTLSGHALRARIYEIAEHFMARYTKLSSSVELSQLMPWGLRSEQARMPRAYYDKQLFIPFEYIDIPVPSAYDDILKRRYGNYMKVVKARAGHDYPCFRTQQESMKKTLLEEAPEIAEKMIPEYRFDKAEYLKMHAGRSGYRGYKALLDEALAQMDAMISAENRADYLADLQQLAVDMGTLIEKLHGEGTKAVRLLEVFCDRLYFVYEALNQAADLGGDVAGIELQQGNEKASASNNNDEMLTSNEKEDASLSDYAEAEISANQKLNPELINRITDLQNSFTDARDEIHRSILNRRCIVFLPFKAEYWKQMETYYNLAKGERKSGFPIRNDEEGLDDVANKFDDDGVNKCSADCTGEKADVNVDTLVVPIPYFYKDFYGRLIQPQYDLESYPKELGVRSYEEVDLELLSPDEIVIQYPYDAFNPVTGILPQHRSDALMKVTNQLTYIPWFELTPFDAKDGSEYYNMKHYALMPGVVNADCVLLSDSQSWMKELYVRKLCEWAGDDTAEIWDAKIRGVKIREGRVDFTGGADVFTHDGVATFSCDAEDFTHDGVATFSCDAEDSTCDDADAFANELDRINKKKILYYIGLGQLLEHGSRMISKMRTSFEVFAANKDRIEVLLVPDPSIQGQLPAFSNELRLEFEALLADIQTEDYCKIIERDSIKEAEKECDAFYGDQGYVMHHVACLGKPIMVQNVDV